MRSVLTTICLVFLSAEVFSFKLGCYSVPCGPNCHISESCGITKGCGFHHGESMCYKSDHCVPMVVRPQEIPKPVTSTAAVSALTPVPGPCLYKKVIVKPAVLPKPVCSPAGSSYVDHCHGYSHHGYSHSQSIIGEGTPDCRSVLFPGVPGGGNCVENQANCAPADAVSLALAYKIAREENRPSEDKLAFGFRRLPTELPPRVIVQNNVPEEKIFALNGQIVELKPVANYGPQKTLEEEAAEDLLALDNEEEESSISNVGPIRRVSLGELGYAPAKFTSPVFEDITSSTGTLSQSTFESKNCNCGTSKCTILPGEIQYKTVPKPEPLCIAPPPCPDSCESSEIEIDQEEAGGCTCSCVPIVLNKCQRHHQQCHKKSSVMIQKLLC